MRAKHLRVEDVFVPGGMPTVTYNERKQLRLEDRVRSYLSAPYQILSITGPSKSGKTVLVKQALAGRKSVLVSGGQVEEFESFWDPVIAHFSIPRTETTTKESGKEKISARNLEAGIKPMGFGANVRSNYSEQRTSGLSRSVTKEGAKGHLAIEALLKSRTTLIIDDFHYIAGKIQQKIVRYLKQPIFEGMRVIILAVPHRAFDAVRVNREMSGRVQQLSIPPWQKYELIDIGDKGFRALGLRMTDLAAYDILVKESIGSPLLMQRFCLEICRYNNIDSSRSQRALKAPSSLRAFFKIQADDLVKPVYERLVRLASEGDRNRLVTSTGDHVTVSEAILLSLHELGAVEEVRYADLKRSLKASLHNLPPSKTIVTTALEKMSDVAKHEMSGEAVLEWDKEYQTLYLADPFFSFYLKWGVQLGDNRDKLTTNLE